MLYNHPIIVHSTQLTGYWVRLVKAMQSVTTALQTNFLSEYRINFKNIIIQFTAVQMTMPETHNIKLKQHLSKTVSTQTTLYNPHDGLLQGCYKLHTF